MGDGSRSTVHELVSGGSQSAHAFEAIDEIRRQIHRRHRRFSRGSAYGIPTQNHRLKRALICLCNILIYCNLEQQDLFVATLLLKLPVLQTTDFLLSSPSLFSQYMTSDHRVAGSSPAGCKSSPIADRLAIVNLKK